MSVFSVPERVTSIRYVRVSFPDFKELGDIGSITGCTTTETVDSSIKITGSLEFCDDAWMTDIDDMVRIYSRSFTGGEVEEVCHATMMVVMPSREMSETSRKGEANLYSVLKAAQDKTIGDVVTLSLGQSPRSLAIRQLESVGLHVIADSSAYLATTDHTWDETATALDIVNDCMEYIGFASAQVDGFGNVLLKKYVDPNDRSPVAKISDTEHQIIGGRVITNEIDRSNIPNVAYVTISNSDGEPIRGQARNDDPNSPYSTINRGREISISETYTELDGSANTKALSNLKSAMRITDKYMLDLLYYKFEMNDVVSIDYKRLGLAVNASAVTREIRYNCKLLCSCTFRRTIDYFEAS